MWQFSRLLANCWRSWVILGPHSIIFTDIYVHSPPPQDISCVFADSNYLSVMNWVGKHCKTISLVNEIFCCRKPFTTSKFFSSCRFRLVSSSLIQWSEWFSPWATHYKQSEKSLKAKHTIVFKIEFVKILFAHTICLICPVWWFQIQLKKKPTTAKTKTCVHKQSRWKGSRTLCLAKCSRLSVSFLISRYFPAWKNIGWNHGIKFTCASYPFTAGIGLLVIVFTRLLSRRLLSSGPNCFVTMNNSSILSVSVSVLLFKQLMTMQFFDMSLPRWIFLSLPVLVHVSDLKLLFEPLTNVHWDQFTCYPDPKIWRFNMFAHKLKICALVQRNSIWEHGDVCSVQIFSSKVVYYNYLSRFFNFSFCFFSDAAFVVSCRTGSPKKWLTSSSLKLLILFFC